MSDAVWGSISVLWFLVSFILVVYYATKSQEAWKSWAVSLGLAFALFCWAINAPSSSPVTTVLPVLSYEVINSSSLNEALVIEAKTGEMGTAEEIAKEIVNNRKKDNKNMIRIFFYSKNQTPGTDKPEHRYTWTKTEGLKLDY